MTLDEISIWVWHFAENSFDALGDWIEWNCPVGRLCILFSFANWKIALKNWTQLFSYWDFVLITKKTISSKKLLKSLSRLKTKSLSKSASSRICSFESKQENLSSSLEIFVIKLIKRRMIKKNINYCSKLGALEQKFAALRRGVAT